ncbi:M15 family metallopeptidase [Nitriliruptoraceae bacterium ZYF776]|nr:M15 family metallopeptidase [Profundirhabdus halotolerans]
MTILLADPRVAAIPVLDRGTALVALPAAPHVLVRRPLAERLVRAQSHLPDGLRLHVVKGYRRLADQQAIIDRYTREVREHHPDADADEVRQLTSRFVSPVEVAPHVAGAAVDLTLVDAAGDELWMGTPIDATPEQSDGACWFHAPVDDEARHNRTLLARALQREGLVNYPTEWWHWSYGDRYWALATGAPHALFGPVDHAVAS